MSYVEKGVDWVGHVHWVGPGNKVTEIVFTSPPGSKHLALQKLLTHFRLDGVNDPTIRGVELQELSSANTKKHVFGRELRVSDKAEETVTPNRYRVRLYLSGMSAGFKAMNLQAKTAEEALIAVAQQHGLKSLTNTGAYVVEEQTKDGLITRLVKYPARFPDAGPLNMAAGSTNVIQLKPENLGVKAATGARPNVVLTDYEQDEIAKWESKQQDKRWKPRQIWKNGGWTTVKDREETISEILDILSKETKVKPKLYLVKKD